jgi:hypothetical protein
VGASPRYWPEGGNGGLIEDQDGRGQREVSAVPERESIVAAIEPVVTPLGLELFDVQFTGTEARGPFVSSSTVAVASTWTRSRRLRNASSPRSTPLTTSDHARSR